MTYEVFNAGKAIRCLVCGSVSYDEKDVAELYCGRCHAFHESTKSVLVSSQKLRLTQVIARAADALVSFDNSAERTDQGNGIWVPIDLYQALYRACKQLEKEGR